MAAPTPPDAEAPPGDAGERGTLSIASRVVSKVALQAARRDPDAAPAERRLGSPVSASSDEGTASLELGLSLRWPVSVAAVTGRVRELVRSDVERMTGLKVDHVDIEVMDMVLTDPVRRVR